MKEWNTVALRFLGQLMGTVSVYAICRLDLFLRGIYGGVRGGVDDQVRIRQLHCIRNGSRTTDIKFRFTEAYYVQSPLGPLLDQTAPHLTITSGD